MTISLRFALLSSLAIGLAACSSDGTATDTGGGGATPDTGFTGDRGFVFPDATQSRPDTGPGLDSGPRDAGHYCAAAGAVDVRGKTVNVGMATTAPSTGGQEAVLSCIDQSYPMGVDGQITFRACLQFVSGSTVATQAELDDLEVAVFHATDPATTMPTDPTFDPRTGADRAPRARVGVDVVIERRNLGCNGGTQIELGRRSMGARALRTTIPYIIRLRSKTSTQAGAVWVTSYHPHSIIPPDSIIGGQVGFCTPQDCTGFIDLIAMRRSAVTTLAQATGVNPAGATNLGDERGDGYAVISASDCARLPMNNAVAGFSPTPGAAGYLRDGRYDRAATATDPSGLYLGFGFANTSSTSPLAVAGAVGVLRNAGTCTEEFAGQELRVYPDALTVMRSGRTNVLHD